MPSQDPIENERALAIEAGALINAGYMADEAGFTRSVALSAAAWADCVTWSVDDSRRQLIQCPRDRLWNVLYMASSAFRLSSIPVDRVLFPVNRVPRDGHSIDSREVTLKAIIENGDGEPAVTIKLLDEA